MRKLFMITILLATIVTGYAQNVDNFEVGPYVVDYNEDGEYKYRLRHGVDLYKYFGLKKDTIMMNPLIETVPFKQGFELDVFMSLPRFAIRGVSNIYGINGNWKQQIGKVAYLNAGLSFAFSFGKYNRGTDNKTCYRKDVMIETGIPVSIEFTKLDYKKASVYAGLGLVPTIYGTLKADEIVYDGERKGEKASGFLISPRIDFGGYIPLKNQIFRVGIYGEYKINCSGDEDVYKNRISRAFVGANVGFVF